MFREKMLPELESTIYYMKSDDFKERLLAEYWQTKIRYEKLEFMCKKDERPSSLLLSEKQRTKYFKAFDKQRLAMCEYLEALEEQMAMLDIDYLNASRDPELLECLQNSKNSTTAPTTEK